MDPVKTVLGILFGITIISVLDSNNVSGNPTGRTVTIPQGRIKGRLSESRNGAFFLEYMGIPYAQKPKRFRNARWPPPKWTDIRNSSYRPPPCFQMKGKVVIGEEDCLTLNVATPANHNNFWILKDMPVMVVFHGGSWTIDRGDWIGGEGDQLGPKYMMDQLIVVVTVNYRLGVLGFFTLFNKDGPANLGLKDQVMALRWVKETISHFGGDPNRVTIVGQGAGAAAVGLHLLSPMSKGLFHQAIMASGSPLCHWALVDDNQMLGLSSFLTELGCDGVADQPAQALECVSAKTLEELETARQKIMGVYSDPFHPFGPVVESWVRSVPRLKVFLPDYPQNILLNSTNDTWGGVPIIMGVNSQDGLNFITGQYLYTSDVKDQYFSNFTKSYPGNFGYGLSRELPSAKDEDGLNALSEKIRQFYYENVPLEDMKKKTYHQVHVDMYSHRNYFQCVKNAAVLYGKWSDVYLYYWNRAGSSFKQWHDYDKLNLTEGVANGDEVHYLFDTADDYGDFSMIRYARPKHLHFSENVVKIWARFAREGKLADDWKSMKGQGKSALKWYKLGDERIMIPEPFTKYTDFWDSIENTDEPRELPPPGDIQKKMLAMKQRNLSGRTDKLDDGRGKEQGKDGHEGKEGEAGKEEENGGKSDEEEEDVDEQQKEDEKEEEEQEQPDGFVYMDLN